MKPYKSVPLLEWQPTASDDVISSAIGKGRELYFGTKSGTLVQAIISENLLPEKLIHSGKILKSVQLFPLTTSSRLGPVFRSTAASLGVTSAAPIVASPHAVIAIATSRPEALEENELICLSRDGHLVLLTSEFQEAPILIAKHVVAFSFDEEFFFGTVPLPDTSKGRLWPNRALLCVSQRKKLQFYRRIEPDGEFSIEKEVPLPDVATQAIWFGRRICLTLGDRYVVYDQSSGSFRPLLPIPATPIKELETTTLKLKMVSTGPGEVLVLGQAGLGIFMNVSALNPPPKSTIPWKRELVAIESVGPYIVGASEENELSVFSSKGQVRLCQVLPYHGPEVCLSVLRGHPEQGTEEDDQSIEPLIVATSDAIWCLTPVRFTAQLQKLVLENRFSEAVQLITIHRPPESFKRKIDFLRLHRVAGWCHFGRRNFQRAFSHFRFSDAPLETVGTLLRFWRNQLNLPNGPLPKQWVHIVLLWLVQHEQSNLSETVGIDFSESIEQESLTEYSSSLTVSLFIPTQHETIEELIYRDKSEMETWTDADIPMSGTSILALESNCEFLDYLHQIRRMVLTCFDTKDVSCIENMKDYDSSESAEKIRRLNKSSSRSSGNTHNVNDGELKHQDKIQNLLETLLSTESWNKYCESIQCPGLKLDESNLNSTKLAHLGFLLRLIDALSITLCQALEESASLIQSIEYQTKISGLIDSVIALALPPYSRCYKSSRSIFATKVLTDKGKHIVDRLVATASEVVCLTPWILNNQESSSLFCPLLCTTTDCDFSRATSTGIKWIARLNNRFLKFQDTLQLFLALPTLTSTKDMDFLFLVKTALLNLLCSCHQSTSFRDSRSLLRQYLSEITKIDSVAVFCSGLVILLVCTIGCTPMKTPLLQQCFYANPTKDKRRNETQIENTAELQTYLSTIQIQQKDGTPLVSVDEALNLIDECCGDVEFSSFTEAESLQPQTDGKEAFKCLFLQIIESACMLKDCQKRCPCLSSEQLTQLALLCTVQIIFFWAVQKEGFTSDIVKRQFLLQLIELEFNLCVPKLLDQIQLLDQQFMLTYERSLCYIRMGLLKNSIEVLIMVGNQESILIAEALCHAVNFGCLQVGSIDQSNSMKRKNDQCASTKRSDDIYCAAADQPHLDDRAVSTTQCLLNHQYQKLPFSSIFDQTANERPLWLSLAEDWSNDHYHHQATIYGCNINCNSYTNGLTHNAPQYSYMTEFSGFDLLSSMNLEFNESFQNGRYASKYQMIYLLIEILLEKWKASSGKSAAMQPSVLEDQQGESNSSSKIDAEEFYRIIILSLLHKYSTHSNLEITEILPILPDEWPVSAVSPYLIHSTRNLIGSEYESQMLRQLSSLAFLKTRTNWGFESSKAITITRERTCAVCSKRVLMPPTDSSSMVVSSASLRGMSQLSSSPLMTFGFDPVTNRYGHIQCLQTSTDQ